MKQLPNLENLPEPLVSIVLPTYNRAHLLDRAISSCLNQTYKNLELIIVDDGSSDHTGDVAGEWTSRDPRVKYVRQQNGKIPRALNTGFEHAKGALYTWTSDDNIFEPDAIETMANHMAMNSDTGLVYCDMKLIDESDQQIGIERRPAPDLIETSNPVGACFLYRASVAKQVGQYDPAAFLAEDYDYWLRISKVARLDYLAGVTPYQYRLHSGSLTSTRTAEAEVQAARARAKHALSSSQKRTILSDGFFRAGNQYRDSGHFFKAIRAYLGSIKLNPANLRAYKGLMASCVRRQPRTRSRYTTLFQSGQS